MLKFLKEKSAAFKNNLLIPISAALLVSITIFLFGPLEILMSESGEFWFDVSDVIGLVVLSTFLCFILLMAVQYIFSLFGEKILFIASSIIAAAGMGFYIQGNWTFVSYGSMDGTPIDWSSYSVWAVINTVIWIAIAVVIILALNKWKKISHICAYVFLGVVGVEVITLGTLTFSYTGQKDKASYTITGNSEFELSKNKENVIVVLADEFDGADFLPVFEEEPDLKSSFDGFTFYENTAGTSIYSEESGITLLTGHQFEVGPSFKDNVDKVYAESDLYDVLKENNYDSYIYLTQEKIISPSILDQVLNSVPEEAEINDAGSAFEQIYNMVAFRYMPHVLKKYFWYCTMDFYSLKDNAYSWYNYDLYDLLQTKGVQTSDTDKNIYQFFWIQGPHSPSNMDRYCQKIDSDQRVYKGDDSFADTQFEQTIGVVRLFTTIIAKLKEAGVYDNTTVIFTADHGSDIRPNPLLLIKPAGNTGELQVSKAPVSMIADYIPTLEYFITDSNDTTGTVYALEEDQKRDRLFYIYDINGADRTYNNRTEIWYNQDAFGPEIKLGEEIGYANLQVKSKYGFFLPEDGFVWTTGNEVELDFHISEEYENIALDMSYSTFNGNQRVEVYAGDNPVADYTACGEEEKTVIIPGEYIEDGNLTLRIVLPDAASPKSLDLRNTDTRVLALAVKYMKLTSTSEEATN